MYWRKIMFNKIAATVIALVVFMSLDAHAEGPLTVVEARVDQFVKILGDKTLGEDEKVKAIEKRPMRPLTSSISPE
jgi:hypothetical protein